MGRAQRNEHSRVFPVMHPDVDLAVCTVNAPSSTTVFQIAVLVEQACGTSTDMLSRSKLLTFLWMSCPFHPLLHVPPVVWMLPLSDGGLRKPLVWRLRGGLIPGLGPCRYRALCTVHFTDAPATNEVLVHRLNRPIVCR